MNTNTQVKAAARRGLHKTPGYRIFLLLLAGTVIGIAGCSSDATPPTPPEPPAPGECVPGETLFTYRLPFHLEYRTAGEMTFSACFDDLEGTMVLAEDYRFLRGGHAYPVRGKRHTLPESEHVLYAWTVPIPDVDTGTCPEGNATVSLTFSARQGWKEFTGGFAVYCGPQIAAGRAHQVLRVHGVLDRTD